MSHQLTAADVTHLVEAKNELVRENYALLARVAELEAEIRRVEAVHACTCRIDAG